MTSNSAHRRVVLKRIAAVAVAVSALSLIALGRQFDAPRVSAEPSATLSSEAFRKAYDVFMHPRCMNCHPVGDVPLQGDDSHLHPQNVQRGPEGKGVYALKCSACHQDTNLPGLNMPPGNPNWHLPPPEMKMVFEGMTPRELCEQMKDPTRNGGKTPEEIFHHVAEDSLVLWGWNPGDGRTLPPLDHDEFTAAMRTWIDNGCECP